MQTSATGMPRHNPHVSLPAEGHADGTRIWCLYGYWRSSAAYRVRIALNLKGLAYESRPVHLVRDGGEQHAADYQALNPQELVPCLLDGGRVFTQSMAIMEYLDETRAGRRPCCPPTRRGRAQVRALAQVVSLRYASAGQPAGAAAAGGAVRCRRAAKGVWSRHWIGEGFRALEAMLAGNVGYRPLLPWRQPDDGGCLPGAAGLQRRALEAADGRLSRPSSVFMRACKALEAFQQAAPEVQPDAPAASGDGSHGGASSKPR